MDKTQQQQLGGSQKQPSMEAVIQGRPDYLETPKYFMATACLVAQRSRDPNTQVGACIVNQENNIVGIGYNCMPNGCEGKLPWSKDSKDWLDRKYPYVCFAALNSIMNKTSHDVKGCTMYITLFPSNECAKDIIQAGIKEVVYLSDKFHGRKKTSTSRLMLKHAGVKYRQYPRPNSEDPESTVIIDFNSFYGPDEPAQGNVTEGEEEEEQRDRD